MKLLAELEMNLSVCRGWNLEGPFASSRRPMSATRRGNVLQCILSTLDARLRFRISIQPAKDHLYLRFDLDEGRLGLYSVFVSLEHWGRWWGLACSSSTEAQSIRPELQFSRILFTDLSILYHPAWQSGLI
jgi:hypothetical protein